MEKVITIALEQLPKEVYRKNPLSRGFGKLLLFIIQKCNIVYTSCGEGCYSIGYRFSLIFSIVERIVVV